MNFRRILMLIVPMACLTLPLLGQREGSADMEGSGHEEGSSTEEKITLLLNGLDPVSLVQGEEEKGKASLSVTHKGHKYLFANAQHKEAFEAEPDKYAVQNGGYCPVGSVRLNRQVEGKPDLFAVHEGRLYLFGHPDARDAFKKNPGEFIRLEREGSGSEAMEEGSGPM
jgi:YHS domain-containing protein